ncbi:MAG: major facilitator transporter [Parcubacteria group bacterium Gr01-1014_8]|nr:MAG: major facilitator transporter [Parcubacteria group bacterium Gr01-1014_8]
MRQIGVFFGRIFASLAIRNYRLYFIGQAVSLSGTWMQLIALGWLALQVTGSGSKLGLIVATQFFPLLVFGVWGGVVADRFDKRKILLLTQAALGILALCMSVLVYAGTMRTWMLFVFAFVWGLIRIFDNPTRQTFVSEMVDAKHLNNAVSLNSTVNNLARAVGPSIGGILIATAGIAFCFLFNAFTYVAVIWMLFLMKEKELHRSPPIGTRSGQLRAGFRYVQSMPRIRGILIMIAVIGTFAYEFQISLPIFAEQTFLSDVSAYAALMSAFGIGSVIGGLYAASRHTVAPHLFVIFGLLFGISIIGTALAPTLVSAIGGMILVGLFSINMSSSANTMVQLESVPEMRGRVMALWTMAITGSTLLGGPLVGWIGEYVGARWGLAIGGIATIVAIVGGSFRLLKKDTSQEVPAEVQIELEEMNIANQKLQ